MKRGKKTLLVLEDGFTLEGFSFSGEGEVYGEVVFNTSMCGYQEILTDPSYKGQIVCLTYPLVGNYGVNGEDVESSRVWVEGFVVREYTPLPSNFRAKESLGEWLKKQGILAIEGIDTRALTRHIRLAGAMKGVISTRDLNPESLKRKAERSPGLVGRDLVKEVTSKEPWVYKKEGKYRVVVVDYGVKYNILRLLSSHGCQVLVVPAHTPAEKILEFKPDGVLLSNGPGDPAGVPYASREVKKLLGKVPLFGICFGHQILGRAFGYSTYKLKFGHHGANHPVKDLRTQKVEITVQNHGFCVDLKGKKNSLRATHLNLNDHTLEGMEHTELPIFSVQYHPEASPGPHDSTYLFERFVRFMEREK